MDKLDLRRLLYIFVRDDLEKLKEIYKEDEMMTKVVKTIEYLTEEYDSVLFYDREELYKQAAEHHGFEKGISQGKTQSHKQIIAKMKSKGYTDDAIAEIVGISKDEINNY